MKQTIVSVLIIAVAALVPLGAQGGQSDPWGNVQRLKPGTEVIVRTANSGDVHRLFVSADRDSLVVMTLTSLHMSGSNKRRVRDIVIRNSPHLLVPQRAEFVNGDVRIMGGDIFVKSQRIAGIADVIERRGRADVQQLRLDLPRRSHPVGRDAIIGAAIGAGIGLALGAAMGCRIGERCDSPGVPQGLASLGAGIGLGVGTAIGASRTPLNPLIYDAAH